MQRLLGAWILVGIVGLITGFPVAKGEEKVTAEIEFTDKAREMNSEKYAAPPTRFRVGKVSPRTLEAKAIKPEGDGFRIDLPSDAPVPTPTVYRNKLYVSGGFHSKEFYCFDAATGKLIWGCDL